LSPLLANVLLDEVTRSWRKRQTHVRAYADDCKRLRAGHDGRATCDGAASAALREAPAPRHEERDAVDLATSGRSWGYSFWVATGPTVSAGGGQSPGTMKEQSPPHHEATAGGASNRSANELRSYLLGWKEYFRLADSRGFFAGLMNGSATASEPFHLITLEEGSTAYRELRARGLFPARAAKVALRTRRCGQLGVLINAAFPHQLLPTSWESPDWPRDLKSPNRPVRNPHAGWCGKGSRGITRPLCLFSGRECPKACGGDVAERC